MHQAKFSLTPPLIEFLNHYKQYGFKDKSSMVQAALFQLKKDFEQENLKQSAQLYAEVYKEETELQELTEAATVGWPE
jgi:hypothetical protein